MGDTVIHTPGTITLRQVLGKIESFLRQVPTLRYVIVIGPKSDRSRFYAARSGNIEKAEAREMLRMALNAYDNDAAAIERVPAGTPTN